LRITACDWKSHNEARSAAARFFDPGLSAILYSYVAYDAESNAAPCSPSRRAAPREWPPDHFTILLYYTRTFVGNRHPQLAIVSADLNANCLSGRSVFHGVVEEIYQHVSHCLGTQQHLRSFSDLRLDSCIASSGKRLEFFNNATRFCRYVY
jgi:hypothetical protein